MCLKVRGSEIQRSLKKQKKPLNAQHFHNSFLRFTQLHQQIRWTRSVIAPQKCCKQACASRIIIPIFSLAALSESFVHCHKRQNDSWKTYQFLFFFTKQSLNVIFQSESQIREMKRRYRPCGWCERQLGTSQQNSSILLQHFGQQGWKSQTLLT